MDWTFDANDFDAFVERWLDEAGDAFRGRKYNGWVFLNGEGEVLDVTVTDVDGEWIAGPAPVPEQAFEYIFTTLAPAGTTDVIAIHTHLASEPGGPCSALDDFAYSADDTARQHGQRVQMVVVLHDDALDGVLYIDRIDDKQPGPAGLRATPIVGAIAQALLNRLEHGDLDVPDSVRESLHQMIDSANTGSTVDRDLASQALDELRAAVAEAEDADEAPNTPKLTIVDPTIIVPPFDAFDPRSWGRGDN